VNDLAGAAPQLAEPPAVATRGILRRLWAGEVPLAQAFWSWTVVVGTALNAASSLLAMALLAMDAPAMAAVGVFGLPIPYNVLMVVAVWRSAESYAGPRLWADLARIGVLLWAIAASVL
jgi:hypothetical protein